MIAGKVWGRTDLLLREPSIEVHRLRVKPNANCSQHLHRYKYNAFLVISGKLFIDVWQADYELVDTTELGPGDFMTVPPNLEHQFRTTQRGALAIEIYYLPSLSADIVRKTVGSVGKKRNKKR